MQADLRPEYPLPRGSSEKFSSVLSHVIPAKAGIQGFQKVTKTLDPGFHRGDEYKVIFSHLGN